MDLFEYTDYYSRWVEITFFATQTAKNVITASQELFVNHGIPEIVISDNGSCFSVEPFQEFAASYKFVHTTS